MLHNIDLREIFEYSHLIYGSGRSKQASKQANIHMHMRNAVTQSRPNECLVKCKEYAECHQTLTLSGRRFFNFYKQYHPRVASFLGLAQLSAVCAWGKPGNEANPMIPYSGKFLFGAKFRIFRIKLQDVKI